MGKLIANDQEVDFSDHDHILRVFRAAVRDELIAHKRDGDPIVVWQDGKVVQIPADQIVIPDAEGEE